MIVFPDSIFVKYLQMLNNKIELKIDVGSHVFPLVLTFTKAHTNHYQTIYKYIDRRICAKSYHAKNFLVIKYPQSANPKELPLKIMSLGVTISTTIGVTENYQSHSHCENDSLFSMISLFKRKYYVHNHYEFNACMVSLLFPFKG
jgi:hypothetical protein